MSELIADGASVDTQPPAPGINVFDDPVGGITRTVAKMLHEAGYREIGLGQDFFVDAEDDGDYRLDLEVALSADGLLPLLVRRTTENHDAGDRAFPLFIQRDDTALFGERVVWRNGRDGLARMDELLAQLSQTLRQMMTESSASSPDVLSFRATARLVHQPSMR